MRYYAVPTLEDAKRLAPWAAKIVKVTGGFMAFATLADYTLWHKNK